jgi:hypothetical protein
MASLTCYVETVTASQGAVHSYLPKLRESIRPILPVLFHVIQMFQIFHRLRGWDGPRRSQQCCRCYVTVQHEKEVP